MVGSTESRADAIFSVAIALTVVICILVPLRFWTRGSLVGHLGADDWLIGVATIISIVNNGLIMLSARYGVGRHIADVDPSVITAALKYNFFNQLLTVVCLAIVKISIAMFLLRLAVTKFHRLVCINFIIFMSLYSFAATFPITFQCIPVAAAFRPIPGAKCLPIGARLGFVYTFSIITIISDFFLVILPIFMLWDTQIPRRQRFMICGILSMGTFAATASIVKSLYLVNYGKMANDFLWNITDVVIWTIVEINVGIASASMPALKPLFKRIIENTLYSGYGSQNHSHPLSTLNKPSSGGLGTGRGISNDIRANSKPRRGTLQDNESEEGIIGISKHTDVRVDVETLSQCGGELGPVGLEKERVVKATQPSYGV